MLGWSRGKVDSDWCIIMSPINKTMIGNKDLEQQFWWHALFQDNPKSIVHCLNMAEYGYILVVQRWIAIFHGQQTKRLRLTAGLLAKNKVWRGTWHPGSPGRWPHRGPSRLQTWNRGASKWTTQKTSPIENAMLIYRGDDRPVDLEVQIHTISVGNGYRIVWTYMDPGTIEYWEQRDNHRNNREDRKTIEK